MLVFEYLSAEYLRWEPVERLIKPREASNPEQSTHQTIQLKGPAGEVFFHFYSDVVFEDSH